MKYERTRYLWRTDDTSIYDINEEIGLLEYFIRGLEIENNSEEPIENSKEYQLSILDYIQDRENELREFALDKLKDIKELESKISDLENRVEQLNNENNCLTETNSELEGQLEKVRIL